MRLAVLTAKGFELRDAPVPECGPEQVLVEAVSCGVCEGDVVAYRRLTRGGSGLEELVMGHEGSGIVKAVGQGVSGLAVGDAVTALTGFYADCFVSPAQQVVKLPPGVDARWALGEPVACAVHAGRRFGIRPGDKVAVVGCGFMGLVCLQLAKVQGAGLICGLDPIPWRVEVARQLGAQTACAPADGVAAELTSRHGDFDVVIEAAGEASALALCGDLVAQHGRLVIVGYHQSRGGLRTVNMRQWNYKAIDVVNGHVRRIHEKVDAMREGMELLAAGKLDVRPLAGYYPLERIEQAFGDLLARKQGLFKAVITPNL